MAVRAAGRGKGRSPRRPRGMSPVRALSAESTNYIVFIYTPEGLSSRETGVGPPPARRRARAMRAQVAPHLFA